MPRTVWATVRDGKIELLDAIELPEGARVLVTLLAESEERSFWQGASEPTLASIWDNDEDDVYAELR